MLHLLWGLLNIGLFIYFIVVCFNATKLIREKLGILTAIFFAFGMLSFVGHADGDTDNQERDSNHIKTWTFNSKDSLERSSDISLEIDLEETLVSTHHLYMQFCKDKKSKQNVPVSANTTITGFVGGIGWKPLSIIINPTTDNLKFEYKVDGTIAWKLLGVTIYAQLKTWKGVAVLK
jgi:hypothetical protein